MNRESVLEDAAAVLEREIVERQTALQAIRQVLKKPTATVASEAEAIDLGVRTGPLLLTAGDIAADVLRSAGRPMHWSQELLPAVKARGARIGAQAFPTALRRHPEITRVARGLFAHVSHQPSAVEPK